MFVAQDADWRDQVTVGINSWVEHNNKSIFGDDAGVFNPDRWLTADKERLSAMNRHWMPVSSLISAHSGGYKLMLTCF